MKKTLFIDQEHDKHRKYNSHEFLYSTYQRPNLLAKGTEHSQLNLANLSIWLDQV